MRTQLSFLLILASVSAVLALGCSPERFDDAGCTTDEQCRSDRVCAAGQCVSPERARELDAGGDSNSSDAGDDTTEFIDVATEENLERFIGTWDSEVTVKSCVVTMQGEECDTSTPQNLGIDVEEGTDADLQFTVELLEDCPMPANLATSRRATFLTNDCLIEGGQGQDEADLTITGEFAEVSRDGQLSFVIAMEGEIGEGNFTQDVRLELDGTATRVDAAP